jgi:formate dehydrogenase major subunit
MHREDVLALGFDDGDHVDLVSYWPEDDVVRCAPSFRIVPYEIPRGCAAAYYPETNPLVPLDHTALASNSPAYKSVIVRLVPAGQGAGPAAGGAGQDATGSDWTHKSDPEPKHQS